MDETEVYLDCFILLGARIECETKYIHPKITEVSAPAYISSSVRNLLGD